MPLIAVLDACVIVPASLRDTLFRTASAKYYRMCFTEDILDEVGRTLINKLGASAEQAENLLRSIRKSFDDSIISSHRPHVSTMPVNEKDKHVLAAAVASNAQVIVTQNMKDFPETSLAPYGIEAQSPDDFLISLFHDNPREMCGIVKAQANALKNPPLSLSEVLHRLSSHTPRFSGLVQEELINMGELALVGSGSTTADE
ncbi:MAG TPA: PIN domain-containing protein [Ktedonosporobacter sp.]|jgi:predicted nucleic acid-binding protein|nr:PIN domain-containing protein [Ktedonosporobacter sp.]